MISTGTFRTRSACLFNPAMKANTKKLSSLRRWPCTDVDQVNYKVQHIETAINRNSTEIDYSNRIQRFFMVMLNKLCCNKTRTAMEL